MGEADMCEKGMGQDKKIPRAVITLNYSDEVVLIKGNNKFTLSVDNDGHLVGIQEKAIKI